MSSAIGSSGLVNAFDHCSTLKMCAAEQTVNWCTGEEASLCERLLLMHLFESYRDVYLFHLILILPFLPGAWNIDGSLPSPIFVLTTAL